MAIVAEVFHPTKMVEQPNSASIGDDRKELMNGFDAGLESIRPVLFRLATGLIEAHAAREWDMMLVDDTGARLPARFVRKCLEAQSIHLPTRYIMAGKNARNNIPTDAYEHRFDELVATDPSRILILTETAATFATLHYLQQELEDRGVESDFAVVSARSPAPKELGRTYVGDEGLAITEQVHLAFEHVDIGDGKLKISRIIRSLVPPHARQYVKRFLPTPPQPTGYPTTNLDNRPIYGLAVASIHPDTQYRDVAAHCYRRMDELAKEFSAQESQ